MPRHQKASSRRRICHRISSANRSPSSDLRVRANLKKIPQEIDRYSSSAEKNGPSEINKENLWRRVIGLTTTSKYTTVFQQHH
jgi:hypothetical protein